MMENQHSQLFCIISTNFSEQDKTFLDIFEESNRILMPVEEDELSLHYSSNYRDIKLTLHEEIVIIYEDHQIVGFIA
jgi:hypothetical protein